MTMLRDLPMTPEVAEALLSLAGARAIVQGYAEVPTHGSSVSAYGLTLLRAAFTSGSRATAVLLAALNATVPAGPAEPGADADAFVAAVSPDLPTKMQNALLQAIERHHQPGGLLHQELDDELPAEVPSESREPTL